jgi:hypothetical protein
MALPNSPATAATSTPPCVGSAIGPPPASSSANWPDCHRWHSPPGRPPGGSTHPSSARCSRVPAPMALPSRNGGCRFVLAPSRSGPSGSGADRNPARISAAASARAPAASRGSMRWRAPSTSGIGSVVRRIRDAASGTFHPSRRTTVTPPRACRRTRVSRRARSTLATRRMSPHQGTGILNPLELCQSMIGSYLPWIRHQERAWLHPQSGLQEPIRRDRLPFRPVGGFVEAELPVQEAGRNGRRTIPQGLNPVLGQGRRTARGSSALTSLSTGSPGSGVLEEGRKEGRKEGHGGYPPERGGRADPVRSHSVGSFDLHEHTPRFSHPQRCSSCLAGAPLRGMIRDLLGSAEGGSSQHHALPALLRPLLDAPHQQRVRDRAVAGRLGEASGQKVLSREPEDRAGLNLGRNAGAPLPARGEAGVAVAPAVPAPSGCVGGPVSGVTRSQPTAPAWRSPSEPAGPRPAILRQRSRSCPLSCWPPSGLAARPG